MMNKRYILTDKTKKLINIKAVLTNDDVLNALREYSKVMSAAYVKNELDMDVIDYLRDNFPQDYKNMITAWSDYTYAFQDLIDVVRNYSDKD